MGERLYPALLDRALCPTLPGSVHFNLSSTTAFHRGLVNGEEVCAGFVNIAGLLPNTLDWRAPAHDMPLAASARLSLQRICSAKFPEDPDGCIDALRIAAMCGPHPFCVRSRWFLARLAGADDEIAWGRAPATIEKRRRGATPDASSASAPSLTAHLQRRTLSQVPIAVPSGADQQQQLHRAAPAAPSISSLGPGWDASARPNHEEAGARLESESPPGPPAHVLEAAAAMEAREAEAREAAAKDAAEQAAAKDAAERAVRRFKRPAGRGAPKQ